MTAVGRILLPLLFLAFLAGCTGTDATSEDRPSGATATESPLPAEGDTLAVVPTVAARLQPSVVTIITGAGTGSGVVYHEDGLIITNEHVIRDLTEVTVAFADGQRVLGSVEAADVVTDLALVRANRTGLPPAKFQSELPQVGELAIVIGSPLGFENTVTAGIISGLHREIPGSARQSQALVDLIQTDAPISPGNSGGAVVDRDGDVVGISEAYIPPQAGAVSLGFAIPSATVIDVVEQLQEDGRAEHAFLGVEPAPITPQIAEQLGLTSTEGVIVVAVVPSGPAAAAGIRPGDVITAMDGEPLATPEELLAVLRNQDPGDTLTVSMRGTSGGEREVDITLIERPSLSE